jgi:hypothetical protein
MVLHVGVLDCTVSVLRCKCEAVEAHPTVFLLLS